MIDKSQAEIAAVKELVSTGDATDWLLCYFHFLQEWERFLSSADSGVAARGERHRLMVSLAALAHIKDKAVFNAEVSADRRRAGMHHGRLSLPHTTTMHHGLTACCMTVLQCS